MPNLKPRGARGKKPLARPSTPTTSVVATLPEVATETPSGANVALALKNGGRARVTASPSDYPSCAEVHLEVGDDTWVTQIALTQREVAALRTALRLAARFAWGRPRR